MVIFKSETHVFVSVALGTLVLNWLNYDLGQTRIFLYVILGGLLPDIDTESPIGMFIPLWLTGIKHRTWTHSIWMLGATTLLGLYYPLAGLGLTIGVATHILADSTTKSMVYFLYPYRQKFGIPLFRTGESDYAICSLSVLGIAYQYLLR